MDSVHGLDPFGMILNPVDRMDAAPAPKHASESWRRVWREGFVPSLPSAGLEALRVALRDDDPRLIQDATTTPPPLMCVQDWPCEAGCVLAYIGAVMQGGFNAATVGEAEQFFAKCCFEADQRLGEAAACRWFLNWFDDTPRDEMLHELLGEVDRAIEHRDAIVVPALPQDVEDPFAAIPSIA